MVFRPSLSKSKECKTCLLTNSYDFSIKFTERGTIANKMLTGADLQIDKSS